MPISTEVLNAPQKTGIERQPFEKRFGYLKSEAQKWYPAWKDLALYLNPTRGSFFTTVPNSGLTIDHKTVIDSHARRCIRDLGNGMISGSASPSRPWFKLGLPDKDLEKYKPVKEYLDECAQRMHMALADSNAYEALRASYEEIATFGTSAMLMLDDYKDIVRFRNFTVGEYFLGVGPDNRVDTFARQYYMTVGALIKEFGIENCSPQVRTAYEQHNTEMWIKVDYLIEPNDNRIEEYKDFKNMPFRSVYWEEGGASDTYLGIRGFEEFPVLAPRWETTTSADLYGRSPGWDVLGDDKMLQTMQIQKLMALDKELNPPMQVDGTVQGAVNTLPGGVTRSSSLLPNAGLRPAYQIKPDINAVREDILEVKKALDDAFFRDLFKMMIEFDRGGVTATEIAERQSEKLNMLSPIISSLNNNQNKQLIDRQFNVMERDGLLPEIDPELEKLIGGMPMKVTYISVFAQAQKMIGITAIENTVNFIGGLSKADPSAMDNLDIDETCRIYADSIGSPAKIIVDPMVVAAKRKARAEAQAKAEQAAAMSQIAEGAAKAGKAAKDLGTTPMGTGSALDKVLAGITGKP
jgi:hypothetical protein